MSGPSGTESGASAPNPQGVYKQQDEPVTKARDTVSGASADVKSMARDAKDGATSLASDAKDRATSLASDAKDEILSQAEAGKSGLAQQMDDAAQALHRSGEQLEGHQDWLAKLVERGADELASLANTVRSNDLRGLFGNLEDLAKRQPALFAGVSMAAGFALVRLGRVAASPGATAQSASQLPSNAATAIGGRSPGAPVESGHGRD